jgi:hypothetical protein
VRLLEVPALCLGSHDFSLVQGFVLLVGRPMEWLVLRGGSRVRNLLSLVMYPKRVHFASLTLSANYWVLGQWTPLTKGLIIA